MRQCVTSPGERPRTRASRLGRADSGSSTGKRRLAMRSGMPAILAPRAAHPKRGRSFSPRDAPCPAWRRAARLLPTAHQVVDTDLFQMLAGLVGVLLANDFEFVIQRPVAL